MARLFTSDLHFGHRNVITYCNRPYDDTEQMDEALINQWNSQVKPNDDVYFLGDFGINKSKALDKSLVGKLNGNKHIILGNHDACFNTLHNNPDCATTHAKVARKYLDAGWRFVDVVKYLMLKDGTHVVMTHLPPDNSLDNRYSQYKLKNNPDFTYLSGHLHAHYLKKDNLIDVGFDGSLKLYTEEELLEIIHDNRKYIPSRVTEHYEKTEAIMLKPFEEERKKGNVRRSDNISGDLCLYNYTDACTYDRAWNDVTRNSRGIVFEVATGKIVALPFPKFFNVGEMPETYLANLPNEPYTITKKMDGSLGIIYYYNGQWRVNTRGSFNSEQAIKATEMLSKYQMKLVNKTQTLLVEIIYPENKIVVNYNGQEQLVLLAVIDNDRQTECSRETVLFLGKFIGMPIVEEHDHTIEEMIALQKILPKDEEGFVVRFESGLRVKIKGHEYMRIHKIIANMSPLSFWESMENGKVKVDYLMELPEEFKKEADLLTNQLESLYDRLKVEIQASVDTVLRNVGLGDMNDNEYRKSIAEYFKKNEILHKSCIFPILLNKEKAADKYIMKNIRPTKNVMKEL